MYCALPTGRPCVLKCPTECNVAICRELIDTFNVALMYILMQWNRYRILS